MVLWAHWQSQRTSFLRFVCCCRLTFSAFWPSWGSPWFRVCHVKKWDGIRKDGGYGNERGVAYESGFDSMGICEERERERVFDCEIVCDTIEYWLGDTGLTKSAANSFHSSIPTTICMLGWYREIREKLLQSYIFFLFYLFSYLNLL